MEQIKEHFIKTAENIEKETEFLPKANSWCNWCDYQERCPKMTHKFKEKKPADEKIERFFHKEGGW